MELAKKQLNGGRKKSYMNTTEKPGISKAVNVAAMIILIKLSEAHGIITDTNELNRSELSMDDVCSPYPLVLRMKDGGRCKIFLNSADLNSMNTIPHPFTLTNPNVTKYRLDSPHIKPYLANCSYTSEKARRNFKMPTATIINLPFIKLFEPFSEPTTNFTGCFETTLSKKYSVDFTELLGENNLNFLNIDPSNSMYASTGSLVKKIKSRVSQHVEILGCKGCSYAPLCNFNKSILMSNNEKIKKQKSTYFKSLKSTTTNRINHLIKNKFCKMIHFSKKYRKHKYVTLLELNVKTLKETNEYSPIKVNKLKKNNLNRNISKLFRLHVNNHLQSNKMSQLLLRKCNLSISSYDYQCIPKQNKFVKLTSCKEIRNRVKREDIYESPTPISIRNEISTEVTLTRKILYNKKGGNYKALKSFRRTKYENFRSRKRVASKNYFKSKLREELQRKKSEKTLTPPKKRKHAITSSIAFKTIARGYNSAFDKTRQAYSNSIKREAHNFNRMIHIKNKIRRNFKEFHLTSEIYREHIPKRTRHRIGFTITKSNAQIIHQSVKHTNNSALMRCRAEFFTAAKLDVSSMLVSNKNYEHTTNKNKIETHDHKSILEENISRNNSMIYIKPKPIASSTRNIKFSRINNKGFIKYKQSKVKGSARQSRSMYKTSDTAPIVFKNNILEGLRRKKYNFNLTNSLFDVTRLTEEENNLTRHHIYKIINKDKTHTSFINDSRGNNETLNYPIDNHYNESKIAPFAVNRQEAAVSKKIKLNFQIHVYTSQSPMDDDDELEQQRRNRHREKREEYQATLERVKVNSYKIYYQDTYTRFRNMTNKYKDENNINNVIVINFQTTMNSTPFCPCMTVTTTNLTTATATTTTTTSTLPPIAIKVIKEERFYESKMTFIIIILLFSTILICSCTSCCTMCTYKCVMHFKTKTWPLVYESGAFEIRKSKKENVIPAF